MANVDVKSPNGQTVGKVELPENVFGAPVREASMHAVVVAQLAARRRGTRLARNRAALLHKGGRKPWRQKGTGRARSGSRRSPLWRGGAAIFGPMPRDFSMKINKKVRAGALRAALTLKARENRIHVVSGLNIDAYKTKQALAFLKALGLNGAMVVIEAANDHVERSFANLQDCCVVRAEGVNVYDVLRHEHLVLTQGALEAINRRLG